MMWIRMPRHVKDNGVITRSESFETRLHDTHVRKDSAAIR